MSKPQLAVVRPSALSRLGWMAFQAAIFAGFMYLFYADCVVRCVKLDQQEKLAAFPFALVMALVIPRFVLWLWTWALRLLRAVWVDRDVEMAPPATLRRAAAGSELARKLVRRD